MLVYGAAAGGEVIDANARSTNLAKRSSASSTSNAFPRDTISFEPFVSPFPAPITASSRFAGYQRLRGFLPRTQATLATVGMIGMSWRESAEPYWPPRRGLSIPPREKINSLQSSSPPNFSGTWVGKLATSSRSTSLSLIPNRNFRYADPSSTSPVEYSGAPVDKREFS